MQIWMNYKSKSTGSQSHMSIFFLNFRSFGRLYTSFAETGDIYRIGLYAITSFLNTVQTLQMVIYRKDTKKNV